jgi:hypothetical protein
MIDGNRNHFPRLRRALAVPALALVLGGAQQDACAVGEPEALTDLRSAFETQLESAVSPFRDAYVRELANLESVRAIREDYEGAVRARDVRLRMEGVESGTTADGTPKNGISGDVIELKMASALISGNTISYDSTRGALIGFKKPRHSATWNLIKVVPGWFDVIATYGCADSRTVRIERRTRDEAPASEELKTGGTFAFYEDTNLLKDTSPPIRRTVVSTGSWDKLVTRNIGKIKLTGTTATLKLEAVDPGNDGIMYLRSLKLVPAAEPGAGGGLVSDADTPESLNELRNQYRLQVESELKDQITAYVRELKELEDRYTAETQLEEALEARSERMRAQALLDDPAAVIPKP